MDTNNPRNRQQATIELFSPIQEMRQHGADEVLYAEGEQAVGCYVIHRGEVALTTSECARSVRCFAAGEIVGLESAICGKPHDFTARARGTIDVGFVSRERLLAYLRSNTANCFPILQVLSNSVNKTYQSVRTSDASADSTPLVELR